MMHQHLGRRQLLVGAGAIGVAVATAALRPATASAQAAAPVRLECPILTYHEVGSRSGFERQVAGYLQRGYQPISLGQLSDLLDGEDLGLWGRPFIISFDDGLRSQKLNALPVLRDWQIPAVFAVMPDWPGDRVHSYMTNDDFKLLVHDYGLEVISHTLNHANLVRERTRNNGSWQAEIVRSRYRLEVIVGDGYEVHGFCYPFGAYDQPTLSLVEQYYSVALSTRAGTTQRSEERLLLRRTSMS